MVIDFSEMAFIKTGLIIMSLLIIPGLVLQGYAQYEMPSDEDMARMMPKDVSGTYTNLENGVSVDFPSGWSGTVNEFPDIVPGEWMIFVLVMDEGRQANQAAMLEGNFATIMLSIGERLDDETPEPEPPVDGYEVNCSYIFAEKITLDGKTAMKLETECIGSDISIRMLTYVYATSEKYVAYVYSTFPASDFDNHLDEFEDSVKTLSINNLVDLKYEIPDEIRSETESQTQIDPPSLELDVGASDESIQKIPDWIKNNAKWWAEGQIGDSDFTNGIQHLIKEKIINIPDLPEQASEVAEEKVPDWVKNNAGWWADGLISEEDFLNGIKYLVGKGIIKV